MKLYCCLLLLFFQIFLVGCSNNPATYTQTMNVQDDGRLQVVTEMHINHGPHSTITVSRKSWITQNENGSVTLSNYSNDNDGNGNDDGDIFPDLQSALAMELGSIRALEDIMVE